MESVSAKNAFVKFFGYNGEIKKLLVGLGRIAKFGTPNSSGAFSIEMPKDFEVKVGEPVRLAEFPKYIFGETVLGCTLGNMEKNLW